MTKQTINVGTSANDRKGDSLRTAFQKVNANFTELYTALGLADTTLNLGNFVFTDNTLSLTNSNGDDSTATRIEIAQPVRIESDLTVGGDILPNTANGGSLGSASSPWHSLYVSNSTIYIGGVPLSLDESGNLLVDGNLIQGGGSNVTTSDTAPVSPEEGDLWYDTVSGRTYIYFDSNWVDSNPVDGEGILSTDKLTNGVRELVLNVSGDRSWVDFPAYDGGNIIVQGAELGASTSSLAIFGSGSVLLSSNAMADGRKLWEFGTEGKLTLPAGTSFEYLAAPLTGHGDGLARLDFTLMTDGVNTNWLAASADPAGSGYSVGDTFTFDEDFLGIPGASVTIEIMSIGEGGSVEDLAFSLPPLYPADIYRDSPINLQVGDEACRWTFGHTGTLTTPGDIQLGADSYLRFPDSSFQGTAFVGDASRLYGNVDEDVEVTVRHITTISAEAASGVGDVMLVDTSSNDDITVVDSDWEMNTGSPEAPIWVPVTTTTVISPSLFEIDVSGVEFQTGSTYTFRNPTATLHTWTFNQQTGTLIAPGGAILSSESITEGPLTSRDFSVELPTEDGTNEHRWTFDNGIGSLTVPGPIRQGDAKLAFNENGGVNVYLTAVDTDETAVFINTTSVQNYATDSVSLAAGANAGLGELEDSWFGAEMVFRAYRDEDAMSFAPSTRPWDGMPSYEAYDLIVAYEPPGGLPVPSAMPPAANSAKDAYLTWQAALDTVTGVSITAGAKELTLSPDGKITLPSGTVPGSGATLHSISTLEDTDCLAIGVPYDSESGIRTWTFGADGALTVPGIITKDNILQLVSSGTSTSAAFQVDGSNTRLLLRTNNGSSNSDLTFDINGTLTLPNYNPVENAPNIKIGTSTRIVDTNSGLTIPAGISGGNVYTSSFTDLASMKLLVTIEGEEDTGDGWPHTQVCEMMVVRRDAGGIITVNSSVYGVVYTGNGPLATLTAIEGTDGRVDIIAESTNEESINVKIHAIEVIRTQ